MAKDTVDRVRHSIRERLEELESERDQLVRALEALGGGSSPRRGRPRSAGSGAGSRKSAGRKRAARGQRRQQVLQVLQGQELGPSAIAREIGVNPTQISGLLRQLAGEGQVSRTAGGKWRLASGGQQTPPDSGAATPAADPVAPGV